MPNKPTTPADKAEEKPHKPTLPTEKPETKPPEVKSATQKLADLATLSKATPTAHPPAARPIATTPEVPAAPLTVPELTNEEKAAAYRKAQQAVLDAEKKLNDLIAQKARGSAILGAQEDLDKVQRQAATVERYAEYANPT